MKDEYLCVFSSCFFVNGHSNTAIIDVQRQNILLLPVEIGKLLSNNLPCKIEVLFDQIDHNFNFNLFDIIQKLLDDEYLFHTSTPFNFIPINKYWSFPSLISNCIIEFDKHLLPFYKEIIENLDSLYCNYYEVRTCSSQMSEIEDFLNILELSMCKSIIIKINGNYFDFKNLDRIHTKYTRISFIEVYSQNIAGKNPKNEFDFVQLYDYKLENKCCGQISINYFSPNIDIYMESNFYNSCLNRKISIDYKGNIKNCLSMTESYGNIRDITLAEAIEKPGFKKHWTITKDKIHVCKDCEFRYICTDCRAYIENPDDIYSKPLKCGYNPYTGEWSEWSTNPLKQKAIDFYGMREMVEMNNESISDK